MDAYVFIKSVTNDGMKRLLTLVKSKSSPVCFASFISGPNDAIATIHGADFPMIEKTVKTKIRGAGVQGTETALALSIQPLPNPPAPTWVIPKASTAFVQGYVEPGQAFPVIQRLAKLPNVLGVCPILGSFDVLLELGADSFEELTETLADMHKVKGLTRSVSNLCAPARGSWRHP
ncbi:MAG: hypothetical protein NVSMB57_02280 [Actinomycetota bacterium]